MSAPTSDQKGIREAINYYVEGLRDGDVEKLKRGFHERAHMCGYLGDTKMVTSIQGLYDFVGSQPAPATTGEPYRCEITSIRTSGNVASAEVAERSYLGHDFATFFHLLREDGRWRIISKVFNAEGPSK